MRTFALRAALFCGIGAFFAADGRAELINGIEFPSGASSFADSVCRFDPLFGGGNRPAQWDPGRILGTPTLFVTQSIGNGGLIELKFDDNLLRGDGAATPDLYVGEGLGTPEYVYVSVRPTPEVATHFDPSLDDNQDGFFELGRYLAARMDGVFGAPIFIDLDQVFAGMSPEFLRFDAVQLVDDVMDLTGSNDTAGFDLLAIGAITSEGREFQIQPGDVDLDGDVDLEDLNLVRNNFGASATGEVPVPGDVYPYDSQVDLRDLNEVRNYFGQRFSNAVPEPHSAALAGGVFVAWMLVARSRRRRGCA